MIFREATNDDIPGIVDLLKISLGEKLMPKNKAYWEWKHLSNPFGPSSVLLGLDGDRIVGVRAFMKWQWTDNKGHTIGAWRAVDTAVHPSFQGKGVFTTLTLKLLGMAPEKNVTFIYNTPNKKSLPGYLKMGWKKFRRAPVKVAISFYGRNGVSHENNLLDNESAFNDFDPENLIPLQKLVDPVCLHTIYSREYLTWRYCRNPNVKYNMKNVQGELLILFRLIDRTWGTELRICDSFITRNGGMELLKSEINRLVREVRPRVITQDWNIVPANFVRIPCVSGPLITARNLKGSFNSIAPLNWRTSIGDIEIF